MDEPVVRCICGEIESNRSHHDERLTSWHPFAGEAAEAARAEVAEPGDGASEYGRLLAERDRLVSQGVDTADLLVPDRPVSAARAEVAEPGDGNPWRDRLVKAESENHCGDDACQTRRTSAAIRVLTGGKEHQDYCWAVEVFEVELGIRDPATVGAEPSNATLDAALIAAARRAEVAEPGDASEYGRLLAERDRLVSQGVDPADLLVPDAPLTRAATTAREPLDASASDQQVEALSVALQRAGVLSKSHMTAADTARCVVAALNDGRDDLGAPDIHQSHAVRAEVAEPGDGHDHNLECDCLPIRVVVDQHGHYWRDYGDGWSMCPVSTENVATEPVSEFYPLGAATAGREPLDAPVPTPAEFLSSTVEQRADFMATVHDCRDESCPRCGARIRTTNARRGGVAGREPLDALREALASAHRPHRPSCPKDRHPGSHLEPPDPCECGVDDLLALDTPDPGAP